MPLESGSTTQETPTTTDTGGEGRAADVDLPAHGDWSLREPGLVAAIRVLCGRVQLRRGDEVLLDLAGTEIAYDSAQVDLPSSGYAYSPCTVHAFLPSRMEITCNRSGRIW